MATSSPELRAHQEWLGYIQPVGLVVTPPALLAAHAYVNRNVIAEQDTLRTLAAVSMECGYSASSIRERIYVGEAGNGILLYTGTTNAEGTLGGLVEVGRKLERHLSNALELGRLCSNDPVCSQHRPDDAQEERFLLGAACHGCLLIAEPSCERRNEFLDRSLVVDTVEDLEAELFPRPK